jgi:hypothetical protein
VYDLGSINVLQYPDMEIYGVTDVNWSEMDQNTFMDSAVTSIDFAKAFILRSMTVSRGQKKYSCNGLTLHCRLNV